MDGAGASPLTALERVLDHLQRVVQAKEAAGLDTSVGAYLEDAIEAAMAAAGRARDNGVGGGVPQIGDAVSVANALLVELEEPLAAGRALVSRSMDLRRQALRLTAAALSLRRQAREIRPSDRQAHRPSADPLGALHGVRVLVVGGTGVQADDLTLQLAALGAEASAVRSLEGAIKEAVEFRPDVLLCDVPFPAAEGLVLELRREGVIAPALAVASADDTGARLDARGAGFASILMRPIVLATLAREIRAVLDV